jgi:hypothetical protein
MLRRELRNWRNRWKSWENPLRRTPTDQRTIRVHIMRAATKTKAPTSHPTPNVPWSSVAHGKVVRESLPMLYGATQVSAGSRCLDDQWFRNFPKGLDSNQHISAKIIKRFLSR